MKRSSYSIFILLSAAAVFSFVLIPAKSARSGTATTRVTISVCGNGIKEGPEVCDTAPNFGTYSATIAGRTCNTECSGWSPYCGDRILQPSYSETCDDANNTSSDGCSSVCAIEAIAPPPSAGGGGSFPGGSSTPTPQTKVVVNGKGYPNSDVHILKDGEILAIVKADSNSDFTFSTTAVTPGVVTFGFWAEDAGGLKSTSLTVTMRVTANAATTISGVFLPPTVDLEKKAVKKGEVLKISGRTVPEVTVYTHVNSENEVIKKIASSKDGSWKLDFDTTPLQGEEFHTAKAMFELKEGDNVIKSGFSQAISFYVGEKAPPTGLKADLNGDGQINLVDFSILLFNWGKKSPPKGDINSDGNVGLTDFSILLFNWTG